MSTTHTISIDFEVYDEAAFRQGASARAHADGLEPDDVASFLDPEQRSISECAVMLFDPGQSPQGCSILGSSGE